MVHARSQIRVFDIADSSGTKGCEHVESISRTNAGEDLKLLVWSQLAENHRV